MTRLLFISLLFISFNGNTTQIDKSQIVNYQKQVQPSQQGSLLAGIQDKIYNAFVESLTSRNNTKLSNLRKKLEILYNEKNQKLILYWRSYLQYYFSIYYLTKKTVIHNCNYTLFKKLCRYVFFIILCEMKNRSKPKNRYNPAKG